MKNEILGKLFTLLEFATCSSEDKERIRQVLTRHSEKDLGQLLALVVTDKEAASAFFENLSQKMSLDGENTEALISSELEMLRMMV